MVFSSVATKQYEKDIYEILDYICFTLNNKKASKDLFDKTIFNIENLKKNPYIGRIVRESDNKSKIVRRILINNYVLYYLVDDDKHIITLLRYCYNMRDTERIINNL